MFSESMKSRWVKRLIAAGVGALLVSPIIGGVASAQAAPPSSSCGTAESSTCANPGGALNPVYTVQPVLKARGHHHPHPGRTPGAVTPGGEIVLELISCVFPGAKVVVKGATYEIKRVVD